MASAIVTALISSILPPMAAKAMDIIKDKGLAIVRFMADKATDKVMDKPMDKAIAMVVNKIDGIVNIEREISNLQTTLCMIQDIVQVAEEKQIDKQGKLTVFIQNWLQDLVDIGYEARDVLDDFITFSSCTITAEEASNPVNFISLFMLSYFGGLSSDTSKLPLAILNRLEKDIRRVRERFDEKKKEGETFATLKSVVGGGSESVKYRRPEVGSFINKQRDGQFLGREDVKEEIMEKILHPSDDNDVHVVAIWGMGGIGKTTLAQSIYNDERVKEDDYPTKNRRWLCVGVNKFRAEKVVKEIVNDKNTTGIGNLQRKLVKKLRGDRFLIVLDDVWNVDGSEWDLLFNPLTHVGNGGLIIITTQKTEVYTAINTKTTYHLLPLSKEDSWSLFESCAYIDGKADSTSELKHIGEEIVKKLNGLPLALKVVGRSMLNKDYSTWTNFLESKLTKDDEIMSALRWSYNHLPRHLKMCFTYCSLFPKGHVFIEKVLVEMWIAHDLIQKEDVGAQYFEQLVNASLLQCVDGKYTMHDLIHDLALLVSNGEFASTNSSLTNDQMKKVRHITITEDDYLKIPRLCKIEKLLTLYITDTLYTTNTLYTTIVEVGSDEEDQERFEYSVLDVIFKQLKSIRVLVLSSERIYEIPDSISELKHLRYLDVRKTSVESLPNSLCHLYNLQMLSAPYAKLPRDIVNISSLRYLRANLSTCKGVGKLTSLQELSSIHVCEGDNIRELGDMQRLCGTLTIKGLGNISTLECDVSALMEKQTFMDKLELKFDKQLEKSTISEEILDSLGCPPNIAYLKIYGYTGVKPPSWMVDRKHKFDKLQTLELSNCPKLEYLPPLGELTSLKRLSLQEVGVKRLGDEFYGKFIDSKVFFPSLESLFFGNLQELEEWDDIIIENSNVSFFPHLKRLEIAGCVKLVSVLPTVSNAANFMKSLSRLEICRCHGLKQLQLVALMSLKELSIHSLKSLLVVDFNRLSSLESLNIDSCEQLQSLPPDFHKLSSLDKLSLMSCPQLQSLPPDFHKLCYLKNLYIFFCPQLQSLPSNFHKLSSLESLSINHCPQLQSLPLDLHKLSSLKSLEINHCPPPDFHKLSSLKSLSIKYCPQLQSLPPDFHKFSSLENFWIDTCPQFESLPSDFHKLSSLKDLCIKDCPQLQSLPPDFHKLSSLESLSIYRCQQLQSLLPDFHKLSSLEKLYIKDCPQLQSLPPDFHKLSSLERLSIDHCPQLQSLPPDFYKLSSLESLDIEYCPQLQSLPANGFPPSLRYFSIVGCPLLYERCKDESGLDSHKINHIRERFLFK